MQPVQMDWSTFIINFIFSRGSDMSKVAKISMTPLFMGLWFENFSFDNKND